MNLGKLVLVPLLAIPVCAQPAPRFEVATIKLAAPNAVRNYVVPSSPDRLSIPSMTLTWLIYTAYQDGMGTAWNVSGGPDWVNKTAFAIEGQAAQPSTQRHLKMMLRTLLEERFGLKLRQETRIGDQYALVLDRSDGKLGPNVEEWNGACTGRQPTADDDPSVPRCLSGYRPPGLFLEGATMFSAADLLSLPQSRALLGTIVHDATGLKGRYKMHLDFSFAPQPPPQPGQTPPEFTGPSLFTAVREQWGLRLEKAKGALHVIVVESAQLPTEN